MYQISYKKFIPSIIHSWTLIFDPNWIVYIPLKCWGLQSWQSGMCDFTVISTKNDFLVGDVIYFCLLIKHSTCWMFIYSMVNVNFLDNNPVFVIIDRFNHFWSIALDVRYWQYNIVVELLNNYVIRSFLQFQIFIPC